MRHVLDQVTLADLLHNDIPVVQAVAGAAAARRGAAVDADAVVARLSDTVLR